MSDTEIETAPVPHRTSRQVTTPPTRGRLKLVFVDYAMLWVLALVLVSATVAYPGFFDRTNLINVFSQNSPLGIVAAGLTLSLIAGNFDFSLGGVFAVSAVIFALSVDNMPLVLALLLALFSAAICGAVTATCVTFLGVNDFIATLGTGSAFGGVAFLISDSAPVMPVNASFAELGNDELLGVPVPIWVMVGVFALAYIVLERSVFGRWLYITGGNRDAGRLAGVPVQALRVAAFTIGAACAGVGGIVAASRLGVAQGNIGTSIALDAFTVVIIGGTSIYGGEGRIWRTMVGLTIIATINNVFDAQAVDANWQAVAKGSILILAVALDRLAHRSS